MSNFIELKKVSVLRGDRKILDNVNLSINSDENVAIIGPNGSGKSTLIKLMTGKIYPSYTEDDTVCKLFGHTQWNIHDLRSMLGIVTNELEYEFHTKITGIEAVLSGFFASIGIWNNHVVTKDMIKKADEMIELLDVSFLKDKKLETMSSGEVRRFLIARALVSNPKVLVLDEPSNSLDIASSVKFHNTMRKIVASGTKIVLVTHRISDNIPEMNRFVFLKKGKIFADGKRVEVFNSNTFSSLFDMEVNIGKNNGLYNIIP
ncbi:molybdenum ABC transporter ATP-binding protein [Endomicrobiia bacterium]|nr:molybdenum ABC transporter ATP-binding protein [Endomicrobiia bacterium]GHT69170.1 molybdenum ABC transporter ATP-binding protein [Endomicrobiia bacterium]